MNYEELKNLASGIWLRGAPSEKSTMIAPVAKSENRSLLGRISDIFLKKGSRRIDSRDRVIKKRSHSILQSTYNMNLQGLKLLMDKDDIRFKNWKSKSKDLSLDELRKSYDFWLKYYRDTYQIYRDLGSSGSPKDMAVYSAKMTYFHSLANYVLDALSAYTSKLQEEYGLTKSKNERQNERPTLGRRVRQLQKTNRITERNTTSHGPFP